MGARGSSSHGGGGTVVNGVIGRDPHLQGYWEPDQSNQGRFDAYAYHEGKNFNRDIWDNVLADNERRNIRYYTGSYYRQMDLHLRTGAGVSRDIIEYIHGATSGMGKFRVPEEFVSYRGGGEDRGTAALLGGTVAQLSDATFLRSKIGKIVTDKGFMSSAVHPTDAWSGIQYKIYVNKGISGMYVDPISVNQGEREFLFNRDTSFKIHGFKTDSSGKVEEIYLEAVRSKH